MDCTWPYLPFEFWMSQKVPKSELPKKELERLLLIVGSRRMHFPEILIFPLQVSREKENTDVLFFQIISPFIFEYKKKIRKNIQEERSIDTDHFQIGVKK